MNVVRRMSLTRKKWPPRRLNQLPKARQARASVPPFLHNSGPWRPPPLRRLLFPPGPFIYGPFRVTSGVLPVGSRHFKNMSTQRRDIGTIYPSH
jgi:hypothetical protein